MILELGSLIVNCQKGSVMKITQMEMGHDPPLLPSATDSAKGDGFAKDDIWQKIFRTTGVIFYWVLEILSQGKFIVYWVEVDAGIYYKLIPDWIESARARILFPAQYRTRIQNQIQNNTWRIISKYHRVISKQASLYLYYWLQLHPRSLSLESFLYPSSQYSKLPQP